MAVCGIATAVQLEGIPVKALMQNHQSHWRKVWPEGAIDNADGDAEVLDMFAKRPKREKEPAIRYPWTIDDDAQATLDSIKYAEKATNNTLGLESVRNGGMDMIFTYDNTARVFERDTPQGNTWAPTSMPGPHTKS